MALTTDKNDPDLGYGSDNKPTEQQKKYLILSEEERAKGFCRPVRFGYFHNIPGCGGYTKMANQIAETYATDPKFYGSTYCVHCRMHRPVEEFTWEDPKSGMNTNIVVGS